MIQLITIDYTEGYIYVIPGTGDDINDVHKVLSGKDFAINEGGVWRVRRTYLDELSNALKPYSKNLSLTHSFERYARDFRERFTEECKDGTKPRVLIYANVNYSRIHSPYFPEVELDNKMKFFLKMAVNSKKYKEGAWDGYIHLFDLKRRIFPTGLLHLATQVLRSKGYPYKIVYRYDRRPPKKYSWYVDDGLTPDPDQIEAVHKAFEAGRSVVKAPTGFGKTCILAKRLTAAFGVRTLFVANKKALLDDAKEEFEAGIVGLGRGTVGEIKDGVFGHFKITSTTTEDDIPDLDMPVMVATIQSLDAKLKDPRTKKKLKEWLRGVEFLMVDEVQAIGTKTWDDVLDNVYAPYRVLLSATPKRTDGATLKIYARGGPLSFFTTAEDQIERGRLSEVEIVCKVYDHKLYNKEDDSIIYHEAYQAWIVENETRNVDYVIKPTLEMLNEGRHVLVLFQYIEHGEVLKNLMIQHGIPEEDIRFIYGSTKNEARKNAIKEFRRGKFRVLIGSTIFDAGVNIPIISGLVLAGAGNSEITLVQRIGRSVRNADYEELIGYLPEFMLENDGHKIAKVVDIYDVNVKFFENQARNRYNVAKGEFGASRVRVEGTIHRPDVKKRKSTVSTEILEADLDRMQTELKSFERNISDDVDDLDDLSMNMDDLLKAFKGMT